MKKKTAILIMLAVAALFIVFIRFGVTGIRTIGGIILVLILPAYLILDYFKLKSDEKLFFALFIGMGLIPLFIWLVNRLIYSLRLSVLVAAVILYSIGFIMQRLKK